MAHARPEFAIILAVVGICLAVGIPRIAAGDLVIGVICIAVAAVIGAWAAITYLRSRQ